jgi:hypothetical protein
LFRSSGRGFILVRRQGGRAALSAVAALMSLVGFASAASAAPAGPPGSANPTKSVPSARSSLSAADAAVARVQQNLHKVAAAVRGTAGKTLASGLSGITISPRTNEISVYWHGQVPGDISGAIVNTCGS